jgi:branched-chain amino acid transport system ATP-binding protein
MSGPLLHVEGLTKRFGGVVAADSIALDLLPGDFHAVIGPNGAGKSTLVALLCGEVVPEGGSVGFDGEDITRLAADLRSRLGLARSFQITSLFPEFTALDNVALAVQARAGHSFHFWKHARRDPSLREPAANALGVVGLEARAETRVDQLSHGEHRQLEIAVALAGRPRLLLLDEPMAGLGPDETARMTALLRKLKGTVTILLIEHDMETVFALADRITVLVYGRVIASGDPTAIRSDPAVREAYLGERDTHADA